MAAIGTGPEMPFVRDADGSFVLDAGRLAVRFGWSEQELQALMRRGLVTSRVERGEGEDAGRWRLSVRCGNRRWQAVVLADGTLAEEELAFAPPQGRRERP
ncbi:DUF6522 family protein [Bosea sp. (in: a-proteobacteria)]|uniref:DUF6522 family protein n=1 Tax=Bosea sp. (in: a-proteobacteria) TaxID=1871050 RepID=UPI00260E9DC2|nr:DUF6522 family protein [Bosea sp. (in: a-proteobacteria)]MCO5093539.1 DUF6522 family protein [Bosea sp. (in: a-proteobacteria)]